MGLDSWHVALLDANVLYPAPLRDLLMQVAVSDVFRAKWTAEIHREWIDALLRNEPHRERAALERTRDLMNRAAPDCLVRGYESLIPGLALPDLDDRHVLAAAIKGRCDVIVTQNLADFPEKVLREHGVRAEHPDRFLCEHLRLAPEQFCSAVGKVRARLRSPAYSVRAYLDILVRQGLVELCGKIEQHSEYL